MEINASIVEAEAQRIIPMVKAKVLPDDVDDVMQDIRIAFWISLPGHRGEAALSTYAHSIARRRIADHWRHAYRERRTMKALIEGNFPTLPIEPEPQNGNGSDWLRPAEKAVFRLLGSGMTNAEIAAALFRDVNTVRSHLKAIYGKLQCHDRVKVALLAHQIFTQEAR